MKFARVVLLLVAAIGNQAFCADNGPSTYRLTVQVTELHAGAADVATLVSAANGSELEAALQAVQSNGQSRIGRVSYLVSDNGQQASAQFGRRVSAATYSSSQPGARTSMSQENLGTSIDVTMDAHGDYCRLDFQYAATRSLAATTDTTGAPTASPHVIQQYHTSLVVKVGETTLLLATTEADECCLLVKVSALPLPMVAARSTPPPASIAENNVNTDAEASVSTRSANGDQRPRLAPADASPNTTRVLDLSNIPDAERRERIAREIVRRLDRDGDGVVGPQEFPESSRSRFDELDVDHDGRIDATELLPK